LAKSGNGWGQYLNVKFVGNKKTTQSLWVKTTFCFAFWGQASKAQRKVVSPCQFFVENKKINFIIIEPRENFQGWILMKKKCLGAIAPNKGLRGLNKKKQIEIASDFKLIERYGKLVEF
jgi:hypothetical protein